MFQDSLLIPPTIWTVLITLSVSAQRFFYALVVPLKLSINKCVLPPVKIWSLLSCSFIILGYNVFLTNLILKKYFLYFKMSSIVDSFDFSRYTVYKITFFITRCLIATNIFISLVLVSKYRLAKYIPDSHAEGEYCCGLQVFSSSCSFSLCETRDLNSYFLPFWFDGISCRFQGRQESSSDSLSNMDYVP
jgi:hypothetical protein